MSHVELITSKNIDRAQLEGELGDEVVSRRRTNEGEAAMYGIYYDDTEYDYMQHLKPTRGPEFDENNIKEDDAVRIEGPKQDKAPEIELPAAVLPSSLLLQHNYQNQQNIPDAIARFQPDMDPNLREVLELLQEDSDEELSKYVYRDEEDEKQVEAGESGDADSWFHQIVAQGEAPKPERRPRREDDAEYDDSLTTTTRTTRKGRKTKASRAASTNFSMTSSALYRTEGLTTLDDRFDMIQEEYAEESQDEDVDDVNSNSTARLKNQIDSAQFEAIMDEFLLDQKVVGKRLQNVPRDSTPVSQLDDLRKLMGSTKIK